MNTFYESIQEEIIDSTKHLSTALRRIKVVAARIGVGEIKEWVDCELDGYPREAKLPDYRIFHGDHLGTFANIGGTWSNVPIPVSRLPDWVRRNVDPVRMHEGCRELEELAATSGEKQLGRRWPAEWIEGSRPHVTTAKGAVLVEANTLFSHSAITGILDTIRNRSLDLLLKFRDITPDIAQSERAFELIPKAEARSAFNITIYGSQNVISAGSGNTSTSNSGIIAGDLESLLRGFAAHGVSKDDLAELREAIRADQTSKRPNTFGERVADWIGRMTKKATLGTWRIASDFAVSLLVSYLNVYYAHDAGKS